MMPNKRVVVWEDEDNISYKETDENGKEIEFTTHTLNYMLKSSGIPKNCWEAKMDFGSAICKKLQRLEEGMGIVLSGTYGCGKTWGIYAWTIQQIKNGKNVICKEANAFYMELKTDEWREKFDKYKKIPILVIDDLGIEYDPQSGYFQSLMDDLINYRYVNKLTTVITTNLPMEKFKERYGGRIIDRLRDWSGYFESKDKSFRGQK